MLIDACDSARFIETYSLLLSRVSGARVPRTSGAYHRYLVDARERLVSQPALLDDVLTALKREGQHVCPEVIAAVRTLQVKRWLFLKETARYAVLIDPDADCVYGALGLTQRLRDVIGGSGAFLETGVLAFNGRYLIDGLVANVVWLGPNTRKEGAEWLRRLRAEKRFYVLSEPASVA